VLGVVGVLTHSRAPGAAMPPFSKLLVANRGEIACRVMRTAKRLGIRTVGIFSEPDAQLPHVRMADEAICVGGAASADSYLHIDRVMEAVRSTGATAVHPGYGFLSENAAFAEAVTAAGAAFVGPPAGAIRAMGDKIESKRLAAAAGVSTIPGVLGVLGSAEEAVRVANEVGYPVMLKASAGGGGKGMRIAYNDAEAAAGFTLSAAEAASSFGDDRIFVERYVEQPRHIEIQLIADGHGSVLYLPPRECSIQRRNQKVVEEAPAPFLAEETVRTMGEEAVSLAKAVGYTSAGTVEYLVDAQQRHYFLEMNTRLQVEHPVTEEVTGVDLVELMIRAAAGERLPLTQADVAARGWSFECRVYAEDPLRGFLPSVGTLSTYTPPQSLPCTSAAAAAATAAGADAAVIAAASEGMVRVDDGVEEGGEISVHYDPMIAKLITHAPSREAARLVMIEALDRYAIQGVRHNINFLRSLVDHPRFAEGRLTTAFIPEEFPDGYDGHVLTADQTADLVACSAALQFAHEFRRVPAAPAHTALARSLSVTLGGGAVPSADDSPPPSDHRVHVSLAPSHAVSVGGTLMAAGAPTLYIACGGDDASGAAPWTRTLRLERSGLDGGGMLEALFLTSASDATLPQSSGAGRPMAVQVIERRPLGWTLSAYGTSYEVLTRPDAFATLATHMKPPPRSALDGALLSPMPGTLLSMAVDVGETVVMGQELCVVEAMKMQNVLHATRDGKVRELLAAPGTTLAADQPIITFEDAAAAA